MVTFKRQIKWDKAAILYFSEAIRFIKRESPDNAQRLKSEILQKIAALSDNPEIFPPDKYRLR